MKSYKNRVWPISQLILSFYLLWNTLNSTNENAGFFFFLGTAIISFAGFLEDSINPAGLARLKMTFPELYQDIRKHGYQPPSVVRPLKFLAYALFALAIYYKFFAHNT